MAKKLSYEDAQAEWSARGQRGLGQYIVLPADRVRQVLDHLKKGTWDDYNTVRAIHFGGFDSLQDAKAFIANNPQRDFGVSPVRIFDVKSGEVFSPPDITETNDVSQFKELVEKYLFEQKWREEDIKYENGDFWVGDVKKAYTVYKTGLTHSVADSSYPRTPDGLSIAIARANYLAREGSSPTEK